MNDLLCVSQEEFIVTARQMLGILDETKDTQEKL